MTEIYEIYNTLDKLASPENLTYAIIAVTGAFVISVGTFFCKEYRDYKKKAEENFNKSKNNLENTLNNSSKL
jgi:C4-dicarboxylate transporter